MGSQNYLKHDVSSVLIARRCRNFINGICMAINIVNSLVCCDCVAKFSGATHAIKKDSSNMKIIPGK